MDAMFGPYIILNRLLILCVLQATQNEWHYWPTKSTAEPMACKIYFSAQWQKTNKKPVSYRQEQEKECLGYGLAEPDASFNKE